MIETGNITTAGFAAYLKCPTKGLLIARGEKPPQTFFVGLENKISAVYKAKFGSGSLVNFRDLVKSSSRKETTTLFDCESAFYTTKPPSAIREDARVKQTNDYIPVLYSAWNKLDEVRPPHHLFRSYGGCTGDGHRITTDRPDHFWRYWMYETGERLRVRKKNQMYR